MRHFKKKILNIFPMQRGPARMFPRARCGSRRACL